VVNQEEDADLSNDKVCAGKRVTFPYRKTESREIRSLPTHTVNYRTLYL
jgi:hypothetical protein